MTPTLRRVVRLATVRELCTYSDWANGAILDSAADRSSADLDRRFEMGMGALRATLLHIHNGEHVWLQRWQGRIETPWPREDEPATVDQVRMRMADTAVARDVFLNRLADADLAQDVVYRDSKGGRFRAALGDMLVQAIVHSHLHRAQALNMLRHVGAALPQPGLDYIFWRRLHARSAVTTDSDTIAALFVYGDWAMQRVFEAAWSLRDEQLDAPFEMGSGSIRATLLHITSAEHWWYRNWAQGPLPFPEPEPATPIALARRQYEERAAARWERLRGLIDADLASIIRAVPKPGVERVFPLGVVLLQICMHGVHHRAQIVNMIRRVGGSPPELDYMMWLRRSE